MSPLIHSTPLPIPDFTPDTPAPSPHHEWTQAGREPARSRDLGLEPGWAGLALELSAVREAGWPLAGLIDRVLPCERQRTGEVARRAGGGVPPEETGQDRLRRALAQLDAGGARLPWRQRLTRGPGRLRP